MAAVVVIVLQRTGGRFSLFSMNTFEGGVGLTPFLSRVFFDNEIRTSHHHKTELLQVVLRVYLL